MTTYTVTAGNRYYWQKLIVEAADADQASMAFNAYLRSDDTLKAEEFEYQEGRSLAHDNDEDPDDVRRSDYTYAFDDEDMEEDEYLSHWTGPATTTVQLVDSGGNG